jgi:hypothetical protein
MSYAALAAAVVGAGVSAYGAYSSSQQQNDALAGIPQYEPIDYSGVIDYLKGNYTTPDLQDYTGTPYDTGYQQFLQGGNKYGGRISNFLEKTNDRSNQQYRSDLFGQSPTLRRNITQQGANTQSFLRGQIPADVQSLVKNNAAETSLFGGFGGSQMARNLTARDLGLTSLDLIGRGNQGLEQQFGLAQRLSPYQSDTLSYLMNPSQLQSNQTNENRYINQSANTNALAEAQSKNQLASLIANLMADQASQDATGQNTNANIAWQKGQGSDPGLAALFAGLGGASGSIDWSSLMKTRNTGPSDYSSGYGNSSLSGFGNDSIYNYLS